MKFIQINSIIETPAIGMFFDKVNNFSQQYDDVNFSIFIQCNFQLEMVLQLDIFCFVDFTGKCYLLCQRFSELELEAFSSEWRKNKTETVMSVIASTKKRRFI